MRDPKPPGQPHPCQGLARLQIQGFLFCRPGSGSFSVDHVLAPPLRSYDLTLGKFLNLSLPQVSGIHRRDDNDKGPN